MNTNLFLFYFAYILNLLNYIPNLFASPIIGGVTDTRNKYSYQVSIRQGYNNEIPNSGQLLCGGTIIHPKYVLSVARHFMTVAHGHMRVIRYPGDHGIAVLSGTIETSGPGTITRVDAIFIPHDYNSGLTWHYGNLSVLKLEENLHTGHDSGILVARVDLEENSGSYYQEESGTIVGNGCDNIDHGAQNCIPALRRKVLEVYILPRSECDQFDYAICAKNLDNSMFRTSCKYDAGNPLIYDDTVIGVISGGPADCTTRLPTLCARTSKFRVFIHEAMNEHTGRRVNMYTLTRRIEYNDFN